MPSEEVDEQGEESEEEIEDFFFFIFQKKKKNYKNDFLMEKFVIWRKHLCM